MSRFSPHRPRGCGWRASFCEGTRPGVVEMAAVENVVVELGVALFGGAGLMGECAARTDPWKARAVEDGG